LGVPSAIWGVVSCSSSRQLTEMERSQVAAPPSSSRDVGPQGGVQLIDAILSKPNYSPTLNVKLPSTLWVSADITFHSTL
jgi:hypothetical protein